MDDLFLVFYRIVILLDLFIRYLKTLNLFRYHFLVKMLKE